MFDGSDLTSLQAAMTILDAFREDDALSLSGAGMQLRSDFLASLSHEETEDRIWAQQHPGNRKGNNSDHDRNVRPHMNLKDNFDQLRELFLYRRYYRRSEERFELLHELMEAFLKVDENKALNSTVRGSISPRVALSATIRWLAGG
jgi:hypothetical protein